MCMCVFMCVCVCVCVCVCSVASEPLHVYFLQSSHTCWRCLFSLEAFSIEQKVRVSLCLHDNIQLQLVTTETAHHQVLHKHLRQEVTIL